MDEPKQEDLYTIGTKAVIRKMSRPTEDLMEVLVIGTERVVILKTRGNGAVHQGASPVLPGSGRKECRGGSPASSAGGPGREGVGLAQSQQAPQDLTRMIAQNEDPLRLVLPAGLDVQPGPAERAEPARSRDARGRPAADARLPVARGAGAGAAEQDRQRGPSEMSKEQREYMLRQQMRAIQEELGEKNPEKAEVDELRERLDKADLPDEVRKEAERELARLERLPAAPPDYQVTRTYLELVLELPWKKATEDKLDICRTPGRCSTRTTTASNEVKERILEHLAVLKLNPEGQGADPVLRRPSRRRQDVARPVDRPGAGPQVRAHEPGRPARRGRAARPSPHLHRRDARPDHPGDAPRRRQQPGADARRGRQARPRLPRRPGGGAARGPRPGAEQARSATTTSTCRSTCRRCSSSRRRTRWTRSRGRCWTAWRSCGCPATARRRRSQIARRYLMPRQLKQTGLTAEQMRVHRRRRCNASSAATRARPACASWSGRIGRWPARSRCGSPRARRTRSTVEPDELERAARAGARSARKQCASELPPGVATGLAWTEAGGEVLYIEATLLPDGKGLTLTGQLGEVMQESAKAAQSYIWSHAERTGHRSRDCSRTRGVHIHVPAGAMPKDGRRRAWRW